MVVWDRTGSPSWCTCLWDRTGGPSWCMCLWDSWNQWAHGKARGTETAQTSLAVGCPCNLMEPWARVPRRLMALPSVCRLHQCWIALSFPPAAWSCAAGGHIPCALLTEILIYAVRSIKNKEFWHSSYSARTLQWVSANSSAAPCSARNPGERLLSWGISSDLIAKL